MFSVKRQPGKPRTPLARILTAATLLLALLSGIAPLSALSSSHNCDMSCCAGKAPHAEGSCNVAFSEELDEEHSGAEGQEASQDHAHHVSQDASQATGHHESAGRTEGHHSSAVEKSSGSASVASRALTRPCSPECAAAAASSTQLRRPRQQAALAADARPHASTQSLFTGHSFEPLHRSAATRRLSRPRAPPSLLANLSA